MDQKLFKVQGNPEIQRLEHYDARKAQQISAKIKDQNDANYVNESLLGLALTLPDKNDFEKKGRCSPKMMCFLLSYIYNFDLFQETPQLPYFIMLQLLNGVCITYDDYNEILRGRRRKVDHNRIVFVILTSEKWVGATFTLGENTLYVMDPTSQDETAIKRAISDLGQKKFKSRYSIQNTEYLSENINDTDGSDIILNSIYSIFVLGFDPSNIKLLALKDQSKARILAVCDQLKFLSETQIFIEQSKKLGAKGNPYLPLLESYEDQQFKEQQKRFQNIKQDPYVTDQQLSIKLSRSDVVQFEKNGKSTPELMVFLLNYIYNNDLFSRIPDYTYFVIYKMEGTSYVKDEALNPLLKARRRKLDHLYIIFLVPYEQRWTLSLFHLEKKKLWIVDTTSKRLNANDLKALFVDLGVKMLKYKYDVKNFQYLNNPYENSVDGSEFLIHFLYAHLCQEKPLETITFTSQEKDTMRSKLLWLFHTIYDIENPKHEDTISKALSSYKAPVQKKNSAAQPTQRFNQPQVQETPKVVNDVKQQEPKILITSEPIGSYRQIPTSMNQAPPSYKQIPDKQQAPPSSRQIPDKQQVPPSYKQIPDNSVRNAQPLQQTEVIQPRDQLRRQTQARNNDAPKPTQHSQFAPDRDRTSIEQDIKPKAILKRQMPQIQEPQKSTQFIADPVNKSSQQTVQRQPQQQNDQSQDDLTIFLKTPQPQYKGKLNSSFNYDSDKTMVPRMMITPSPVPTFNVNGNNTSKDKNHKDVLDRIQSNLLNYLNDISSKPFVSDQKKLKEISKLNDQIQNVLKIRRSFDLQDQDESNDVEQKKNQFINIDDNRVANNLNMFLDVNIRSPNKMKNNVQFNYMKSILQESFDMSIRGPSNVNQSLLIDSKIIADRYGIQLRSPDVQGFLKQMKVAPNVFNFLLGYIQEKSNYHQFKNPKQVFVYQSTIKVFPLNFYTSLTQSSLTNTSSIDYIEASRFTHEHTGSILIISQQIGLGRTLFDTHEWVVIPIMDFPCEYSLIIANLREHEIQLFQLSSQSIRQQDPLFKDPYKNPYMRNIQAFLRREEKTKTIQLKDQPYQMQFGIINRDPNYNLKMTYDYSGLYALYVIIHLAKYSNLLDVSIMEYQMKTLSQSLHDVIERIGPNPSLKLNTLFDEKKWPF